MSAVSLQGVSKQFGPVRALDDVSLEIPDGSFTALIGRSGCGKSTLLQLCNGLQRPDSGALLLDGAPLDPGDLLHLRRQIGYAVQGTGLFPHLDVQHNIDLLARLESWSAAAIAERVLALLDLMQLPPSLLPRYPHELSGGQQQRVGLCRAMMLQPRLLLLDEPFAAIDPLTRRDIHRQLLVLHREEPCTTVLVTHDMREAMLLADTIVVMDRGAVVRQFAVSELDASGRDPEELLLSLIPQVPV